MIKNRNAEMAFNKKEIHPNLLYIKNDEGSNKHYIFALGKTPRGKYPQGFQVSYSMSEEEAKQTIKNYTEEYNQINK